MALSHDYDVLLCTCCVLLLASDETCQCGDGHADRLLSTLDRHVATGGSVVPPSSGEPHFSTLACDGCGETLHGDRWETPVLVPICQQDILSAQ